jgi:hypothetical protein
MSHIPYFSLIFLILKGNDFICVGLIFIFFICIFFNAGLNPESIKGSKTGVFVTAALNESDDDFIYQKFNPACLDFIE